MTPEKSNGGFGSLGLTPQLLSIVNAAGFVEPTPIQKKAIPTALTGRDLVGIAQTGTGKTLAFGLPLIQRIIGNNGQALVVVPTRELAFQVEETFKKIGTRLALKIAVIIGGVDQRRQIDQLRRNPHVIIATPGRLMDHMQQRTVSMNYIKVVVLDEADRMFDIGFAPQIKRIMSALPKERQTMLFSATMPKTIAALVADYTKNPERVEVAPTGTTAQAIDQGVYFIEHKQKASLLQTLLVKNPGTVLVFSRTKYGTKKIAAQLCASGHSAVEIHSNRSLSQRKQALAGFKNGTYRILVATDIAARGIDVHNISLVINYDLPDSIDDYVHRIGRTGRAGLTGSAVSFVQPDERNDLRAIEHLIRQKLPIIPLPELAQLVAIAPPTRGPRGGYSASAQPSSRPFRSSRHSRFGESGNRPNPRKRVYSR